MATELKRQVAALKQQKVGPDGLQAGKASLFLGKKEAGSVDVNSVLEAATGGLRTLAQYEGRFTPFLSSLFHSSSVDFQRELKTKEENKTLNDEIHRFLDLISLWIDEPNSHLTLEYLLRRYRIHEFNVDRLLRTTIASHDTKIFAKIVQHCKLDGTQWGFLSGVKSAGSPLPRQLLVKSVIENPRLVEVLCQQVLTVLQLVGIRNIGSTSATKVSPRAKEGAHKTLAFFTAVIVELAAKSALDETVIRSIYLYLIEGMKTPFSKVFSDEQTQLLTDWKNSSLMIATQMSHKTNFGESLSKALTNSLSQSVAEGLKSPEQFSEYGQDVASTSLMVLTVLAQQGQSKVSHKALVSLYCHVEAVTWLHEHLLSQTEQGVDVRPLCEQLAAAMVRGLTSSDMPAGEDQHTLNAGIQTDEVVFFIQNMLLTKAFALELLIKVLNGVSSFSSSALDNLKAVIRCISHQMPSVFDAAMGEVFKDKGTASDSLDKISSYLSEAFSMDSHHMVDFAGDSLFMALSSPIKVLRMQALQKIGSMTSFPQEDLPDLVGLAEGVTRCMLENDIEISLVAFSLHTVQFILSYLPAEIVYQTLAASWAWWVQYTCSLDAEKGLEMLRRLLSCLRTTEVLEKLLDNKLDRICWIQGLAAAVVYSNDSKFETLYTSLSALVQEFSQVSPAFSLYTVDNRSKASRKISKAIDTKDEFKRHFIQGIQTILQSDNSFAWIDSVMSLSFDFRDLIAYRDFCCLGLFSVFFDAVSGLENTDNLSNLLQRLLRTISAIVFDASLTVNAKLVSGFLNCFRKANKLFVVNADSHASIERFASRFGFLESNSLERLCLQFLVKLLLSNNIAHVQLFSKALNTLFPNAQLSVLYHMLASDASLAHPDYKVIFSASLEAWRLYGIHELTKDKTSSEVSVWTVLTVGLVSHLGGHADSDVRAVLVETIADLVGSLPPLGNLAVAFNESLPSHLSSKEFRILQWDHVVSFLNAVKERSSIVLLQADGIRSIALEVLAQQTSILRALWMLVAILPSAQSLMRLAIASIVTDVEATQTWAGDFAKHVLTKIIEGQNACALLISKVVACLGKGFSLNRSSLLDFFILVLEMKVQGQAIHSVKDAIISTMKTDFCSLFTSDESDALLEKLLPIYIDDVTHQSSLLELLSSLSPSYSAVLGVVQEKIDYFLKVAGADERSVMEVDEETKEAVSHHLESAVVLDKLFLVLEASVPTFTRCQGVPVTAYSSMLQLLFCVLREMRNANYRVMLSHEYIKMMLVEFIFAVFVRMRDADLIDSFGSLLDSSSAPAVEATPAAKKKSRKPRSDSVSSVDASASKSSPFLGYRKEDVVNDVKLIMLCMGEFKQAEAHHHAFGILSILLKLHKGASEAAIEGLGQLLSSSHFGQHVSKEKFLTGILEVLLPILAPKSTEGGENEVVIDSGMQLIVQNLCSSLALMSKIHRKSLLKTALKVLHNGGALVFLIVHNLLLHTIANYERDFLVRAKSKTQVDTICISKASQRRAQRLLHSSPPEEFFQLSLSLLLQVPYVDRKLEVLIDFVNTASEIVRTSLNDSKKSESKSLLDADKSLSYLAKLSAPDSMEQADGKEYAATLAILHIEYVLEVLENKEYHVQIAKYIADHPGSNKVQTCFLELADSLLQLINYIDFRKRLPRSASDDKAKLVSLRLEEEVYSISHFAYLEILSSRSMNVLQSLQLMFDAPTFISIFQELLEHEVLGVRQKVMLVLRERLARLMQYERPNLAEIDLYLELSSHVRGIVRDHSTALVPGQMLASGQTAHAQSAIMCLDILIQLLGGQKSWQSESSAILEEFHAIAFELYKRVEKSDAAKYLADAKKLLGSLFLCIATTCRVLGAGSLHHLPKLMELLQRILRNEIDNLTSVGSEGAVNSRSDLLFLQSLYSTVTVVIISVPSFFHPYLSALFSSLWQYSSHYYRTKGTHSKEQNGVMQAIDICVTTIGNYISPRMLLPICLESIAEVFNSGHETSLKFVQMLRSVAEKSERNSVISCMSKWLSVSQALLDYRRAFGDHSATSEAVENTVHSVVSELCLKFTETELKAFMTQLNDWKNNSEPRDGQVWTKEARFVAFYGLQQRLLERLQSLYYSTMALFWQELPETLKYVAKQGKKTISKRTGESHEEDEFFAATSSAKKRRRNVAEENNIDDTSRSLLDELVSLGGLVLSCVSLLCGSSEVTFISEERYESVASNIADFIPLRQMFSSDTRYMDFCSEILSPALTAVTSSISKDLLWKPVNHQILMLTRNKHPAVKRVAVNLLRDLFTQVGDDYTALLPECLPFMSELLEDDNNDVIADTRRAISAIEDLTGEKLDELLS